MATKAIHLEVVSDLTSSGFISAFRRFVSRRGLCTNLYSDCGTNFVGANKVLSRELQLVIQQYKAEIAELLANQGTQWHFNPPSAPHFGGLWEAGVKSVKTHLLKVTKNVSFTFEDMYTLLCQIEACVNSRPLIPMSNDVNCDEYLTPGHFLIGRNLLSIPEQNIDPNQTIVKKWKHTQLLVQQFWKKWHQEYLQTLQQRYKWKTPQESLVLDDIVLIKDERFPPTQWPIGRIIEIHPGTDAHVRVATIKIQNTTLTRPITKLCKLPLIN